MRMLLPALLVSWAATGCGGGQGGTACDTHMGMQHVCWDYGGASAETEAQGTCMAEPGTVVSSCPTANRLGSCSVPSQNGVTTTLYIYSDNGGTAAVAQSECTDNDGTWTPAP